MFPDERARSTRRSAVAALAVIAIFGLLNGALGIGMVIRGIHDRNVEIPPSNFGFVGNADLAIPLFMLWLASIAAMWASAVVGVAALLRVRAGWLRIAAFGVLGPAMMVVVFWLTQHFVPGGDPWTRGSRELSEGGGIVAVAVIGSLALAWLLKPALRRQPPIPPPDPATRIYFESTT